MECLAVFVSVSYSGKYFINTTLMRPCCFFYIFIEFVICVDRTVSLYYAMYLKLIVIHFHPKVYTACYWCTLSWICSLCRQKLTFWLCEHIVYAWIVHNMCLPPQLPVPSSQPAVGNGVDQEGQVVLNNWRHSMGPAQMASLEDSVSGGSSSISCEHSPASIQY